jgi:hypothetical protein
MYTCLQDALCGAVEVGDAALLELAAAQGQVHQKLGDVCIGRDLVQLHDLLLVAPLQDDADCS